MASSTDSAALEALLWSDLGNRLALGVVLTATVEVVEQQARCDIIAQRAQFIIALSSSLAQRAYELAAAQVASAHAAKKETDHWRAVMDATAAESIALAQEAANAAAAAAASAAAPVAVQQPAVNATSPHQLSPDRTAAAAEAAAMQQETDTLRTQLDELRHATERAKRECAAAETRILEVKTRELAASSEFEAQRVRIAELKNDADKLRESVAALRAEEIAAGDALRHRQIESLDQRRALEGELAILRVDVRTAQEHLLTLRTEVAAMEGERAALKASRDEEAAMQARVASVVREVNSGSSYRSGGGGAFGSSGVEASEEHEEAAVPSLRPSSNPPALGAVATSSSSSFTGGVAPQDLSPIAASRRDTAPSPTRLGGTSKGQPVNTSGNGANGSASIESGLQALQSVRDQLRDLRGQSAPVTSFGSPTRQLHDDSLARAHTAYYSNPRDSLIGAARLQTSSSAILDSSAAHLGAASPWKQRLVKLQGDLKTLRSELAQPTPTTTSR